MFSFNFFLKMHDHLVQFVGVEKIEKYYPENKFDEKLGVISWKLCHLIFKNYIPYCDFDLKFEFYS